MGAGSPGGGDGGAAVCEERGREQGLLMELWIILSWKGSMGITECSSAEESRQILPALEGALPW